MLRALWLVVASDLLEYVTGNLRAVLNMFVKLFLIKQVKASQKSLAGAIYKEGKRRVLDNLRMPKLQETFTTVAIVCHHS